MEVLLGIGLIGGTTWLVCAIAQGVSRASAERRAQETLQRDFANRVVVAQAKRRAKVARLNTKARALQRALLQLHGAPDFRRAASFAAQASDVPVAFRQRQFRRFRPRLLRHYVARLQHGADGAVLLSSLRDLLTALSIAPYEADYVKQEAERLQTPQAQPRTAPNYAQRLAELQRDHEQRLAALRALTAVEPEAMEQLVETEQNRFRDAIAQLNDQPRTP